MTNIINKIINFYNFVFLLIKCNFLKIRKITPNHNLPKKLTVSLTAKIERFQFLNLVLISIFNQSIHPDEIILWIEKKDKNQVPKKIMKMQKFGLKILYCKNLRSYNKLIHTIKIRKKNYIVTFDDDIFYHKDSLKYLIRKSIGHPKDIIANRIHRIILDKLKKPIDYKNWRWNCIDPKRNTLNFLTGVYGTLYPPNCFFKDILKSNIFKKLSPYADDVWIYWMIRLNKRFIVWSGFQNRNMEIFNFDKNNLRNMNVSKNINDVQIKKMIKYYGFPK